MGKKKVTQILSGGQAVIKQLKKENVSCVFGLIGSATMEIFDALYYEKSIRPKALHQVTTKQRH